MTTLAVMKLTSHTAGVSISERLSRRRRDSLCTLRRGTQDCCRPRNCDTRATDDERRCPLSASAAAAAADGVVLLEDNVRSRGPNAATMAMCRLCASAPRTVTVWISPRLLKRRSISRPGMQARGNSRGVSDRQLVCIHSSSPSASPLEGVVPRCLRWAAAADATTSAGPNWPASTQMPLSGNGMKTTSICQGREGDGRAACCRRLTCS